MLFVTLCLVIVSLSKTALLLSDSLDCRSFTRFVLLGIK